jgi:outer membrane immunogenic protein
MKTFLLATGVLLAATAVPAFAQDADTTAAPTMSAPSDGPTFTGPRAEIFGGWDRVGTRARFDDGTTRDTTRDHKSAWTGGGLLGYDMPIGDRLTVGVLGSYAISTAKTCNYSDGDGSVGGCLKSGRELEGGARVGYKVTPRTLVYAKAAYVNGQIRGKFGDGADYVGGHANRDGGRLGAGAEFAVSNHAYVKAEYDYTRFKSFHADDLGVEDTSLRYDRNQVLAGFGVHF